MRKIGYSINIIGPTILINCGQDRVIERLRILSFTLIYIFFSMDNILSFWYN